MTLLLRHPSQGHPVVSMAMKQSLLQFRQRYRHFEEQVLLFRLRSIEVLLVVILATVVFDEMVANDLRVLDLTGRFNKHVSPIQRLLEIVLELVGNAEFEFGFGFE
jgi:hypothetical protein